MKRSLVLTGIVCFVMAFLGTAVCITTLPSMVEAQGTTLRADRLVIASETGGRQGPAQGSPGPHEGAVQLTDVNGKTRIGVDMGGPGGTTPNAFGFHLRTEDGTIIGNLGVVNGGSGVSLALSDQQGRRRINLLVDTDGTPSMQLLDADGNVTWSAP